MTEFAVGDIVINTFYNVHCLILKKYFDTNGNKNCITLLLSESKELGKDAGSTLTWGGWPRLPFWDKVA